MTVAVASGVTTDDYFATTDTVSAGNGTVTAADGTNPRFDLAVSRAGTVTVLAGTAAANPVFPTFLSTDAVLAAIYVGAGVTTITSVDIIDKRLVLPTPATGSTDLSYTAATRVVASSTGADATLTLADGADPGLMTAANFTKLGGIETGATADQTAAEILTAIKTVDGAGSGLDADLLDGINGADLATKASPTFTGTVTIPSGAVLGTPASLDLTNATGAPETALNRIIARQYFT